MPAPKTRIDCVVLCNGTPPSKQLLKHYLQFTQLFIVADGGMRTVIKYEVQPDHLIGDFDSYSPTGSESFHVHHDPSQETNDLEKALSLAQQKDVDSVVVLGATGRRLDHSLKNLSVLKQFNRRFSELFFHDNHGITRLIESNFEQAYQIGTAISLFPLSGIVTGITTEGLQYPLNNQDLINGEQDGSSNKVISSPVRIQYKEGDLLLFEVTSSHS